MLFKYLVCLLKITGINVVCLVYKMTTRIRMHVWFLFEPKVDKRIYRRLLSMCISNVLCGAY